MTTLDGKVVDDLAEYLSVKRHGEEKVLIGGSSFYLDKHFQNKFGEDFKTLFVGDSIHADCHLAFDNYKPKNWYICLILEELQELEEGYPDQEYYNYCMYWGSALHDKSLNGGIDKTYKFHFAEKKADKAFSSLSSREALNFLTI